MSKVYIQINDSNHIINVNSDIFLTNFDGWICIDEGKGDKYALALNNYFEKPIFNEYGVSIYEYIDKTVRERSPEEIERDNQMIINIDKKEDSSVTMEVLYQKIEGLEGALANIQSLLEALNG